MVRDINSLAQGISKHVSTCKSARYLCTTQASFESWFRVELVPVLVELGIDYETVSPDYTYPGTRYKADLVCSSAEGRILMELKSFVSGQDSYKKDQYPNQIERLRSLLAQDASVGQVIAFTTFQGYSPRQITMLIGRLFDPSQWSMVGPIPVVDEYPSLQFLIAGITKVL
jgi:hypothetical protein